MGDEDSYRVEIAGHDCGFSVGRGERILSAAIRAGVWMPFECGWGSCGTCKVTLVEGETELLFADAPSITPRDARRRRVLACQSTALSDLVVKPTWIADSPRDGFAAARFAAVLTAKDALGPDIWRLRFELDGIAGFYEGQHAIIDLGGGMRRCYSMSNMPGSCDVEFIMKRYAGRPVSEAVAALTPGEQVSIEGPYGDMWIRDSAAPICLVAGGTGISPILAMLRKLVGAADRRTIRVFYGANNIDDLVCWDELGVLTGELANAGLTGVLVSPSPDWPGAAGMVTDALAAALPDLTSADFYIAGPPVMTDAVTSLLAQNGIQLDRISYDSFG